MINLSLKTKCFFWLFVYFICAANVIGVVSVMLFGQTQEAIVSTVLLGFCNGLFVGYLFMRILNEVDV